MTYLFFFFWPGASEAGAPPAPDFVPYRGFHKNVGRLMSH